MKKFPEKAIRKQLASIDSCLLGEINDFSSLRVHEAQRLNFMLFSLLEGDWESVLGTYLDLDAHIKLEFMDPIINKYIEGEIQSILQEISAEQRKAKASLPPINLPDLLNE